MVRKYLDLVMKEGEGLKIEFKESFESKNLSKEIVAFANSTGGKIFLGIDDNGKIKGVEITNKLKSQIQDLAKNCDPSINIELKGIGNILIIEVFEGKNKPYFCSSGFYFRNGANSQKMKREEILDFVISEGRVRFDEIITNVKDYSSDLVKDYLKRIGMKENVDMNVLINLGVCDVNGNLNNAGILFFTEKPKKYMINAYITCARYKGIEKVNVIDRKDFEGGLISQVENSMEFIKRNTSLSYEIKDLARREIPEYPSEAVREALLNAVMHRDYFIEGGNVQIDIYDNRLTITNIGGLMKPLTIETFGKVAVRRNPLIADLFHRINFIERMGTGIKRIREGCEKHGGVEFNFEVEGYFISEFKLISGKTGGKKVIENQGESDQLNQVDAKLTQVDAKLTQELLDKEKEVLFFMIQNKKINSTKLQKLFGVSREMANRYFKRLIDRKLIIRKGIGKSTYYVLVEGFR
jgi:ATP-dependent DNA helicase RecG